MLNKDAHEDALPPIKNIAERIGVPRYLSVLSYLDSFFVLSHFWFAMPQLVLHADWQEVWHSPQPPFLALSQRLRVWIVWICFIMIASISYSASIIADAKTAVNSRQHAIPGRVFPDLRAFGKNPAFRRLQFAHKSGIIYN